MAPVRQRRVADPVSAAHRRPALATLPPFAGPGHCVYAHAKPELAAEASKEPDGADATQWFDVL
jgi:hypothetical protein